MLTLYRLKPGFQALLRPLARRLAARGVTANQITLIALVGSLLVGAMVAGAVGFRWLFLLIPLWLAVRLVLNALDGLLAREFDQSSPLGAYLNEIADVVSDVALYLPFALVVPFDPLWVGAIVFLAVLSEFAGVLGPLVGASRRYDGPMGKSDRALVIAALGVAIALTPELPLWTAWVMPGLAALLCLTVINRVRGGLAELPVARPDELRPRTACNNEPR